MSTAALLLLVSPALSNDDATAWGRFRGPNGSGVAGGAQSVPTAIGPEQNLLWRRELPSGFSSPALTDRHVIVTAVDGVVLSTVCLDRATGEVVWSADAPRQLEKPHSGVNSPAAPSPTTDGENVYVFFEACGLLSYDAEGELRWMREVGPFKTPYGMGTSPILADGMVVMQCDHDGGSFLIAFDAANGEERWRTPRPGMTHGFSSPTIYRPEDGPAELIVSGSYEVAGYDLASGEKLWWRTGMAWQSKSLPVIDGDMLYVHSWMASPTEFGARKLDQEWPDALVALDTDDDGSISRAEATELGLAQLWFLYDLDDDGGMDEEEWGYALARGRTENGLYAIKLGGRGDVTATHSVWKYRRSLPNIPSPLFYDGLLYVLKEGGILTALDPADGASIKSERIEGAMDTYYASPVAAGGRLITASHEGRVAVIEAGADWNVLNVSDFGETIWATPAVADGQVFVRTEEALYGFAAGDDDGAEGNSSSASWPGWRGPARDGISTETAWKVEGATESLWSRDVGLGYSAVAVEDGRLFTMGYDEDAGLDSVWCLDPVTGEPIWQHAYEAEIWDELHGGGTLTTPTIDGDALYTLNREGNLYCLDAASGEVRWHVQARDTYGATAGKWGFAASPLILGDQLILNLGKLVALDKESGEHLWSSADYGSSYSTPAVFELDGDPLLAVFNGNGLALVHEKSGEQRAFREWKTRFDINAATPIVIGDSIFVSSGLGRGGALLAMSSPELEPRWENKAMGNKMSGCVLIDEHLYGYDEAVLKCIDLAGEVRWQERGLGNGAVTGAGDKVLVMTGDGELIVIGATPDGYTELSRAAVIDDGGVFWTMPVLANGLIYCRSSNGTLVCRDHRAKG